MGLQEFQQQVRKQKPQLAKIYNKQYIHLFTEEEERKY